MALRALSLCAGIGGFDLGLAGLARTVVHIEREAFAVACLVAQMQAGRLPPAPVWSDIATFDGRPWRGAVDLVMGGLPCQPFSLAGEQRGEDDERHLWSEAARIITETGASLVFLENVGLRAFREPWRDLRAMGFVCAPPMLHTASELGSPQIRRRAFLLAAHPDRVAAGRLEPWRWVWANGTADAEPRDAGVCAAGAGSAELALGQGERRDHGAEQPAVAGGGREASGASGQRQPGKQHASPRRGEPDTQGRGEPFAGGNRRGRDAEWSGWVFDRKRQTLRHDADGCDMRCRICGSPWAAESPTVRVADGVPSRMDRLHVLGNAVVPAVVRAAFLGLWGELMA